MSLTSFRQSTKATIGKNLKDKQFSEIEADVNLGTESSADLYNESGVQGCSITLLIDSTSPKILVRVSRSTAGKNSENFHFRLFKEIYLQQLFYYLSPRGVLRILGVKRFDKLPSPILERLQKSSMACTKILESKQEENTGDSLNPFWLVFSVYPEFANLTSFLKRRGADLFLSDFFVMNFQILYHLALFESALGFQHRNLTPFRIVVDQRSNFKFSALSKYKSKSEAKIKREIEEREIEGTEPIEFSSKFDLYSRAWTVESPLTFLLSGFSRAFINVPGLLEDEKKQVSSKKMEEKK